ncbi:NlpC/P60 family protein [Paraclostridium bifermentans]|uniref:C40 family peptidase n=1 Tax=Paraclostridium bifermentans TaxID=1490 RepID=UPI001897CF1D|nr:NlpC/P60 family protein [Paraclostridium bifermentans]
MLKRKVLIPITAIMIVSSSMSAFANEDKGSSKIKDEYKKITYKTAKVNAKKGINIRNTPKVEDKNKLYAVPKGTELEILGQDNDWYKVELENEQSGWINSNYVDVKKDSLYISANNVNFREEKNLHSKVYEILEKDTKVEFLEDNGDWIKVKYNNEEGYIYSKYITNEKPFIKIKEEVVKGVTSSSVNGNTTQQISKPQENVNIEQNNENNETDVIQSPSANTDKPEQDINAGAENSKPEESQTPPASNSSKQSAIVDLAYSQLGKPYVWGAEGPNSFDCSGLMTYIFKNAGGINLPRTSSQQSNFGTTVSRSNLQPGDLIFSSTDGSGGVSHVGVYVGNGEMIHAPKPGDVVKKSNINTSYWNGAYLWAKRVI